MRQSRRNPHDGQLKKTHTGIRLRPGHLVPWMRSPRSGAVAASGRRPLPYHRDLARYVGVTGAMRALFWPSPGVIEVGLHNQIWAARTPQPPSDVFIFRLSESGYRHLRRHLRSTIGAPEPIVVGEGSRFYPSKQSYHLFHHCHQYAAEALREAGLPVSAWAAFSRTSLAMQLRRAVRLAADEDVAKTIGDFQAAEEPK